MRKQERSGAFRRSRRQIVAVIMAVFLVLLSVTLGAIYIISYRQLYQENLDMLEIYIEQYLENGNPSQREDMPPLGESVPEPDGAPDNGRFLRSSFYSIAFDGDGQPFSVDLGSGTVYTEAQLTDTAQYLLAQGQSQGTHGNFVYCVDREASYTLVVLMDNTLVSDSFTTLFRNALILGAGMVAVLFLCAIGLARWIIRPLEESDRRQRQFISDAGHELKTPVAVVEANAELLEREVGANKWLSNIRSESSRMAGLVSELLELVRTEQEPPRMEPVALSHLVLGGVLPFESVAFELGRTLTHQIDADITVPGNPGQLSQLVSILMDNALSHSAGAGGIAVTLRRERAGAILTVSNPGFIPEADRAEIFDRFFRSDANRGGTGHYGLGLTIARNIVDAHQGDIQVACGDGRVTFTVTLPARGKARRAP